MKRILFLSISLIMALALNAMEPEWPKNGKTALLMVHFGTTFDDTRAFTIDAINEKAAKAFPDMKVVEAYTSRIVIRRLAKRGIEKSTPREMLIRLAAEGYTHVFVQGTNIIDGIESENLRNDVMLMKTFFKDLRVGRPLLYSIDDCRNVVNIISSRHATHAGKNAAVILVGHGTATPANAIYSQMDYMFTADGHPGFNVATVEGYPTFDTVLAKLKNGKIKMVTLVPFMFVAGDHARNDIDVEWRHNLQQNGFKVSSVIEGLGQIPEIQDIYIDHIHQGLEKRPLNASEHKAEFLMENND